jgi:predicted TIM-barrel fold metal-dependent hydrolase
MRTIAIEEALLPIELFPEWERTGGEFPDPLKTLLTDVDGQRLEEMDRGGIELAILSVTVPGPQAESDPERAETMARDANDALAAAVARRPDRFAGLAALSMHDSQVACAELERAVRDLGMCGALLNNFQTAGPGGTDALYYDARQYDPFWELVQELDVPIYLHPGLGLRMQDFDAAPWLTDASWGFAVHAGLHALRIITTGVFDRFPDVQLVLGHNGEHIVYDMWRIENRIARRPQNCPMERPLRSYFQTNVHVSTSGNFSDHGLRHAISEVGADRIMFAVDYPFEENEAGTSWFAAAPITDDERAAIGRENAIRLFSLADRLDATPA